jgi:hypothetical protein
MLELKLDAPTNMPAVVVTELTSQFEMLELKLDAPLNISFINVTSLTHQSPISPNSVRVAQVGIVAQFWLM